MHHRAPSAPHRYRTTSHQEGSIATADFLGSFPSYDFPLKPRLPEIAFLGRSNVGKSSLINAVLSRKDLAHTSKTPGKTQTANVYRVERSYYLVDLPGYGFAQVSKSARRGFRRLIRDYLKHRESATGVVWLLDIRREPSEDDRELAQLLVDRQLPVLVAITKADKMGRGSRPQRVRTILEKVGVGEDQCVVTSAVKREGLEELREVIQELVSP